MSTHNIPFSIQKRRITLQYPKSAAVGIFQGIQERVRNSRGVQSTEVLLVGCFGFNGPLRQYFSLYRTVSQREGEKREMIDE